MQDHYGVGSSEALRFSHNIQRCIWITEDGDYTTVPVLQRIARETGLPDDVVQRLVVDRRGDDSDPGVQGWKRNHAEAVSLGECLS